VEINKEGKKEIIRKKKEKARKPNIDKLSNKVK
jgi:hypothetical protein